MNRGRVMGAAGEFDDPDHRDGRKDAYNNAAMLDGVGADTRDEGLQPSAGLLIGFLDPVLDGRPGRFDCFSHQRGGGGSRAERIWQRRNRTGRGSRRFLESFVSLQDFEESPFTFGHP